MSNNLNSEKFAEKDKLKSSEQYYQSHKNKNYKNNFPKRNRNYKHQKPNTHKYNTSKSQNGFWYAVYKLSPKYGIPIIIMIAISFASGIVLKDTSSNLIQVIIGIINAIFIFVISSYMCINAYMDEHSKPSTLNTKYSKYSKPIHEIIKIYEHDKNNRDNR